MQEQALVAWANSKLPSPSDGLETSGPSSQLQTQLQTRLRHMFSSSKPLASALAAVEERLRRGRLSLQDEVLVCIYFVLLLELCRP